jgi:transcriptional regulator with XRE-family HTH domain
MRIRYPHAGGSARKKSREVVVDLSTKSREVVDVDPGYQMQQLGKVIRDARRGKHLSLEALAVQAEVSSGLLSQIERGLGNPSFVTLTKIATALDVPMTAFYQGPPAEGRMLVTKSQRQRLALPHGITYELLSPDFDGPFALMTGSIEANFSSEGNPVRHEGTETTHILSGRLEMNIDGVSYVLSEGDSITFDSDQIHWMRNPLNRNCEFVMTVSTSRLAGRSRSAGGDTRGRLPQRKRD